MVPNTMQVYSNRNPISDPAYRFGGFSLLPEDRLLLREGDAVSLPPKVFDLLLLLVENAGHLVRRERIMEALWSNVYVEDANLTNSIVLLRRVLGGEAIQTVPRHGYRFAMPLEGRPGVSDVVFGRFREACDLLWKRSPEALKQARALFWLCLADAPDFADAWAWLGRCSRFLHKYGVEPEESGLLAQKALERALALNPDLACAHQFYTLQQADQGRAKDAMIRLLARVRKHPHDAESFAGLVQVFRFCGLLRESVDAHHRAVALDPSITTSVSHTHFAACDYAAVVDSYRGGAASYLDLAAWAALGLQARSIEQGRQRLGGGALPPVMVALVRSLLAALEGDTNVVAVTVESVPLEDDPEAAFYFARHLAFCGLYQHATRWLTRCTDGGFWCGQALERDPWLSAWRLRTGPEVLIETARRREDEARRSLPALPAHA